MCIASTNQTNQPTNRAPDAACLRPQQLRPHLPPHLAPSVPGRVATSRAPADPSRSDPLVDKAHNHLMSLTNFALQLRVGYCARFESRVGCDLSRVEAVGIRVGVRRLQFNFI